MNHILVVDDNPMDRELVRRLVEHNVTMHAEFASNGLEAIEHLEATTPLVVLTDLQMPELDGLELVRTMRRRFPTIPVVLMTAHGSEDIALEALVEGASDYVPKHRLASDLSHVLEGVLNAIVGDRRHEQITRYLRYKQLRYSIESDVSLIPPLVDQLQQAAASLGLIDQVDRVRLARCLAEALRNAVVHGSATAATKSSQNPKEWLRVDVTSEFTPDEARFVIRDQGSGFDSAGSLEQAPAPQCLTDNSGRGLTLIRLFMDDVLFNTTGNEITLVKRKSSVPNPEPVPAGAW